MERTPVPPQPAKHFTKVKRHDFRFDSWSSVQSHLVRLSETYKEVVDAIRRLPGKSQLELRLLSYKSADGLRTLYFFDQESYSKFREAVLWIPRATPVCAKELLLESKDAPSRKVLVVKSSVNQQVHEAPIVADWSLTLEFVLAGVPRHFLPFEFFYSAPNGICSFHDAASWALFFKFATSTANKGQRYFEVTAGRGTVQQQVQACRREYATSVLPLMQQHQALQQDARLTPEQRLEAQVRLTEAMASLRSPAGRHFEVEAGIRASMREAPTAADPSRWKKLYDLRQHFVRDAERAELCGNGNYFNTFTVQEFNTDSAEMLPLLMEELARVDAEL